MGVHKYIYALRGWLAFVAFMDIGTAIRSFLDDDFLRVKVYTVNPEATVHPAMPRLFGIWCILNATVVIHCALCIHYLPTDFVSRRIKQSDQFQLVAQFLFFGVLLRDMTSGGRFRCIVLFYFTLLLEFPFMTLIYVMTILSLFLSILTYILEAFVFQTIALGLSVIFPLSVNGVTVILLCFAPPYLWSPEYIYDDSDEDEDILKKGFFYRKSCSKKKRQ